LRVLTLCGAVSLVIILRVGATRILKIDNSVGVIIEPVLTLRFRIRLVVVGSAGTTKVIREIGSAIPVII